MLSIDQRFDKTNRLWLEINIPNVGVFWIEALGAANIARELRQKVTEQQDPIEVLLGAKIIRLDEQSASQFARGIEQQLTV